MLIGIPKEIKNHEYRVGATPFGVREMAESGNKILVQKSAGEAIGFLDQQYIEAGATILDRAEDIYQNAEMILKVKEPQEEECAMIKEGQIIFSYLHLAAEKKLTKLLVDSKCIAIAFETVSADDNSLPLLAPMSEIAGRFSVQAGANALEKKNGGCGILLGGAPGAIASKVTIIGGGVAGTNAAKIAIGMGARVVILDKSLNRIRYLCDIFGNSASILYASSENIKGNIIDSDLVIGAVLIPGSSAPKMVNKETIKQMRGGSVMVDISIDQGGCFETSKPTSHSNPTYLVDNIIHYCVTNMPGAVPKTSTQALENATLPFTLSLANKGYKNALIANKHLRNGANIIDGKITYKAVAEFLGYQYYDPLDILQR